MLYIWASLGWEVGDIPVQMGITDDEDKAKALAGAPVITDAAFAGVVQQVRMATGTDLMPCYAVTGAGWFGVPVSGRMRWVRELAQAP